MVAIASSTFGCSIMVMLTFVVSTSVRKGVISMSVKTGLRCLMRICSQGLRAPQHRLVRINQNVVHALRGGEAKVCFLAIGKDASQKNRLPVRGSEGPIDRHRGDKIFRDLALH